MYRKAMVLLIVLVLISLSLTSNAESVQVDQILKSENATLHISAEVELPLAERLPVLVAEENRFDVDQILHLFFSDTTEPVTVQANEYDETYITCADGSEFDFSGGVFCYRGGHYLHHYRDPESYVKMPETELIGFPAENAEAIAEEWLCALGFQDFELVFTLPISLDSLRERRFDGQLEATEQNEGYFLRYDLSYHETLCMPRIRFSKYHDDAVRGIELEIVVTRSGMQYFSTAAGDTTYRVIREQERDERIATLDEAIEALKERYNQLILPDPIEINQIRFYYILEPVIGTGVQTYELWPAWVFYSLPYSEDIGAYEDDADPLCIVNAITREIME